MAFLYGDLTPAPFATNFLEELRDVVDLVAAIAELDQIIVTTDARRAAMKAAVDEDLARIEVLASAVVTAMESADKGAEGSPASVLATELAESLGKRRANVEASARVKLEADLTQDEAATVAARRDYFPVLERFFLTKQLPGSRTSTKVVMSPAAKKDERRYFAIIGGESDVGLDWSIELDIPTEGVWTQPLRIDRILDDGLSIIAPQLSGLIKKDVKQKKQKLDRYVVTSVIDDGSLLHLEIREDVGDAEGFDIVASFAARTVRIVKTGADDDASVGAFETEEEDVARLLELAKKVRSLVAVLTKKRLVAARFETLAFDGTNAESQPRLVELVPRVVAKLAPFVHEIASRSRSEKELVLRRILDDDRREELFMSRERVREQLYGLDEAHRALFAALEEALSVTAERRDPSIAPPPIRAEVPPSGRPARRESGSMGAVVVPKIEPVPTVKEDPVLEIHEEEEEIDEPAPEEENVEATPEEKPAEQVEAKVEEAAAEEKVEAKVEEKPEPPKAPQSIAPPSRATTELVATLKHIRGMTKDGLGEEAMRQYAVLFGSAQFAMCTHEDQRKALTLLLHQGPTPSPASPPSEDAKSAYKAALPILQALVLHHRDPADYEMLGMAYVALEEPAKATEMYKRALEIERARDPGSDLCGTLMRRVSEL